MKKTYSKPDVVFESFSLCTSIAGGCEVKTSLPFENGCGWQFGEFIVFLSSATGCAVQIEDHKTVEFDMPCYHNPSDTNNLFNS